MSTISTRYVIRNKSDGLLSTSGPSDSVRPVANPFFEGLVEDIILDHFHGQYSPDGYNVGAAKVRIFAIHNSAETANLDWAFPLDTTIQHYPLIGEVVIIQKIFGKFYYSTITNLTHKLQENVMLNLSKVLENRYASIRSGPLKIKPSVNLISGVENAPIKHEFGKYFQPDSRVRQLKHFEGDVLIQGRMGHSIRLGSSQMDPSSKGMAPSLILRTGQAKNIETEESTTDKIYGLILEDVNKDASSIWMVADQVVPYEPITIDAGSFYRSLKNPPQKYDGASITLNSDRIVIGSKKSHILLFSNEEIHLNSFKNTSIDTDGSILMTANTDIRMYSGKNTDIVADIDHTIRAGGDIFSLSMNKTSFLSNKIYIGSVKNDTEPMVGGRSLSIFLCRLILALMGTGTLPKQTTAGAALPPVPSIGTNAMMHVLGMGPSALHPKVIKNLTELYIELAKPNTGQAIPKLFAGGPFNSGDNFVNLGNEVVKMQKNNFKDGKSQTVKNNEWVLTDDYYKVIDV